MTRNELLAILAEVPLIASVQASEGSPLADPATLQKLARASLSEGVRVLRLEGIESIRRLRQTLDVPVIGLVKKAYPGSEVYITATQVEVDALIEAGCEVIALDGTGRGRPGGAPLESLIQRIHAAGRLAMADCDTVASAKASIQAGADVVGTTLSGYTAGSAHSTEPNIALLRQILAIESAVPVLAEGRYSETWQVRMALRAGALGVVVGGAVNDPVKQTRKFAAAANFPTEPVGAIDIGGTWLRASTVSPSGQITEREQIPLPPTRVERNQWINAWLKRHSLKTVGIGAGGTIRPATGEVVFSKPIIPDHVGTVFGREIEGETVVALNDGHATAWGHALHPEMAGQRVATLALGTGVGFGIVDRGRILMGPRGEHPRINDTPTRSGRIFDDLLGGASVTANPSGEQKRQAIEAAEEAIRLIHTLYYPEVIVLAGGIGLQPWLPIEVLKAACPSAELRRSPYGPDAGLIGAAFLALFPFDR